MATVRTYEFARKGRTNKRGAQHKKGVKADPGRARAVHHSFVMSDALTVLIVDDEPQIRRVVRNALLADPTFLRAGLDDTQAMPELRVLEAESGQEGIDLAAAQEPALVVLDLGLPDMEGIAVCREIRRWSSAPILVLSARHADTEKVALLDAGADDYMTKPFSSGELMARVRAQFRRTRGAASRTSGAAGIPLSFGDVSVDQQRRRVERSGKPVHLTPTEWSLLRAFIARPRQTLTHRQLFSDVWGNASGDAQQYLRVYVGHLRRKIEDDPMRPKYIHTEPGVGYRFEPDGESASAE
jgi:two-component system, OmpR family, KDP operon response regulator KdpE